MGIEADFEKSFVVNYLNSIGYDTSKSKSDFNINTLLIENVFIDWIWENNYIVCESATEKYFNGNVQEFNKDFCIEASKFLYEKNSNVAIQLNPSNSFKFKEFNFSFYNAFNNDDDDKNLYHCINQLSFNYNGLTKIPDVGIFVNGILFSVCELKTQATSQSAKIEGRNQIVLNFIQSINNNKEKGLPLCENMKIFNNIVHWVTMDLNQVFIIRSLNKHFKDVSKIFKDLSKNNVNIGNNTINEIKKSILSDFFEDSISQKETFVNNEDKLKKCLKHLYGKWHIQNEILYFNFKNEVLESSYNNGKKEVIKRGYKFTIGYPRPNQKYGVEKVIKDVIQKYKQEKDFNYEENKLRSKLNGYSEEEIQLVLEERKKFQNNTNNFSLLLQYAAGFGKTYIICWLSLILKDLLNNKVNLSNNMHLFDKILIISDRLDLKDQVDRAMHNMNLDKSLFVEIESTQQLSEVLNSKNERILIVNIQKFPNLKSILEKEKVNLSDKRIAFVIDEIHRSNSGEQHQSMSSLFDEVDSFSTNNVSNKKNLIIGLTATPTDENLIRFGEYNRSLTGSKWEPFDAYTMEEAIKDNFVLDPTKNIILCSIPMIIDESSSGRAPSTKEIYESIDRNKLVAEKITNFLLDVTYSRIKGEGKAMLCCYSVEAANNYYEILTKSIKEKSVGKYEKYADTKVYIVYTGTNSLNKTCYNLCGYNSEKEVISSFKRDKNGIMIVVDKLQTGFDEPKLHTLFLDKTVSGITAVQTLSRVNRTRKDKVDSVVIDFSIDNENAKRIRDAFSKYEKKNVSIMDVNSYKTNLEDNYKKIIKSYIYSNFYESFNNEDHTKVFSNITYYINNSLKNDHSKRLLFDEIENMYSFKRILNILFNLLKLDLKYKDEVFSDFINRVLNIFKTELKSKSSDEINSLNFNFDVAGFIKEVGDYEIKDDSTIKPSKIKINSSTGLDSLDKILDLIDKENDKFKSIEEFKLLLNKIFILMEEVALKNNDGLIQKIKNKSIVNQQNIYNDSRRVFGSISRRAKDEDVKEFISFLKEKDGLVDLVISDFIKYIEEK